ncbi:hypothetical protein [Kutzneria chonburiensis]|uniref:Secreted protein n=1 Tax=Kutzneria chonburiensis TaxID=1483604 RepID=A0ABV6MTE3_9PSEU|nr:hypothetical protein [Kutzneria chonburiensis]
MKVMLIVFALLLAGGAASSSTAGSGHRAQPVCGALNPSPDTVSLDGFTVSWVLRCPVQLRAEPVQTQRADGPATEVMRVLKMPSDPKPDACSSWGQNLPDYVLVDAAGNGIQPVLPTDGCHVKKSVVDALDALPYRTVKTGNR